MALTKVSRGLLSTGIVDNSTTTAITIDSSENVGINSAPDSLLHVAGAANLRIAYNGTSVNYMDADTNIFRSGNGTERLRIGSTGIIYVNGDGTGGRISGDGSGGLNLQDGNGRQSFKIMSPSSGSSQAMTLDASSNLLVGHSGTADSVVDNGGQGVSIRPTDVLIGSTGACLYLNREDSDGVLAAFRKDGTNVGSIGSIAGGYLSISGTTGGRLQINGTDEYAWDTTQFYPANDNANDLGFITKRWDDIYATNGTIQTSDRNEKQDIEALSDAEQRVAVAAKGLMRKFRWIDAVEAKGDDARIHFGIIAQDLQAAFEAEGLDAARYAMFTSNTWWETQTEVAAVEAVEATEDTEAIEAVDAYTRTDTYDTAEEAPEGATERTRLGVRYSELLAFIIAAI